MQFLFIFALFTLVSVANGQSIRALQSFDSGLALSRSGDHAKALTEFESTLAAIEREGAAERFFAKTHYNLGVSLYQLRRLDGAVAHFAKALRYEKNRYENAHYALGLAQFERGDLSAARTALNNALLLNNRNGEAWFDLAFAHLAAGFRDDARRAFEKALKHGAAERVAALNNIGVLLAIDGKYAEAIVKFESAIEGGDQSVVARENLDKCRRLVNGGHSELLAASLKLAKRGRTDRL